MLPYRKAQGSKASRTNIRWVRTVIWTAVLVAVLLSGLWVWEQLQPMNPSDSHATYLTVHSGESAVSIGQTLQDKGLIHSAFVFRILSRTSGLSRSLERGVYRIRLDQSPRQIIAMMQQGDVAATKVSIPEGFTVQQIVARLAANHIGTMAEYRVLLRTPLPGMPLAAAGVRDPYEGYLFPATYEFPHGTTARQALDLMWQTFTAHALPLYHASHTALSLVQWVTLASIIQREDKLPADAPEVSGVFTNRLKIGMPLQSDATVRYALAKNTSGPVDYQQLQVHSPFNTYVNKGLPPGPISDPGTVALNAALHPASVPYLYFISLPSGQILFATTYPGQLANIAYANKHP